MTFTRAQKLGGQAGEPAAGHLFAVVAMVRCGHSPDGFNQLLDLAAEAGVMPFAELAPRAVPIRLTPPRPLKAADLAVPKAEVEVLTAPSARSFVPGGDRTRDGRPTYLEATAALVSPASLVVDLVSAALDPRIRLDHA